MYKGDTAVAVRAETAWSRRLTPKALDIRAICKRMELLDAAPHVNFTLLDFQHWGWASGGLCSYGNQH